MNLLIFNPPPPTTVMVLSAYAPGNCVAGTFLDGCLVVMSVAFRPPHQRQRRVWACVCVALRVCNVSRVMLSGTYF